jgi:hypothetical protein
MNRRERRSIIKERIRTIEVIEKINDEKLKEMIKDCFQSRDTNRFLEILKYLSNDLQLFDMEIDSNSIDDVIPDCTGDRNVIILGYVVLNGEWYSFSLLLHGNDFTLAIVIIDKSIIDYLWNEVNQRLNDD